MIVFLDANALIYLLEGTRPVAATVRSKLKELAAEHPGLILGMSALSRLECRVGPMKAGNSKTLAAYDTFFAKPGLTLVSLSDTVVDLATAIRVEHGLKTPDALQAACCLQFGPKHVFLTGDQAFTRVAGLHTQLLD